MEKIVLTFNEQAYDDEVMYHLGGTVFHLTTAKAYRNIRKTKAICSNANGQFPVNTASENSFGRCRGWVCLFDFRGKTDAEIEDGRLRYNFLGPSWFWQYFKEYKKLDIIYLILSESCYHEIVPNKVAWEAFRATGEYKHFVPDVECWFPDSLSLTKIRKTLVLRVIESAPSGGISRELYDMEYRSRRRSNESMQPTS